MAQPIPQLLGNARGIVQQQIGIGAAPRIEGTSVVVGTPPTPGASTPGGASIMNVATPAVNRAIIVWAAAVVVLFAFHVGGARFG